jgi:hypothetical protein
VVLVTLVEAKGKYDNIISKILVYIIATLPKESAKKCSSNVSSFAMQNLFFAKNLNCCKWNNLQFIQEKKTCCIIFSLDSQKSSRKLLGQTPHKILNVAISYL